MQNVKYYIETPIEEMNDDDKKLKDLLVDKVISKVLEKKYGVKDKLLIFQEDIMALCSYGAGFTLGEADDVRRAMGKKKMELMLSFEDKFKEGWDRNVGVFSKEVWDKMVDYAKYCFNKSHAVAYTLITIKTAELQKYHFDEYMKWNYINLKKELKAVAAEMMEKRGVKKFPNFSRPYEGISFGSLSFKNIELSEDDANYKTEYDFLSELYFTSDVKYKLHFLLRGLYDHWTKDILGLVTLKKKLGKKADGGSWTLPQTDSFKEFLNMLVMKNYIKFIETDSGYNITTKVKESVFNEDNYFMVYKDIDHMPKLNRQYRVKSLIKEFGVCKYEDFTTFPLEVLDEISKLQGILDRTFERFEEYNPDKVINNNIANVILKAGRFQDYFDRIEKKLGHFLVGVNSFNTTKNGTCKVDLQFSNCSRILYTRDINMKTTVEKNDIIDVQISLYKYLGRDKRYKILFDIKKI